MKTINIIIIGLVAFLLLSNFSSTHTNNIDKIVIVEINYGESHSLQEENVIWEEGMTALEALQHVATVSTHPVGKYVVVTSINNIKGVRGEMAWYYKVNGESPGVIAMNNILNPGDTISWIYKKDVCSEKADTNK